jgi:hypothetical protein
MTKQRRSPKLSTPRSPKIAKNQQKTASFQKKNRALKATQNCHMIKERFCWELKARE